MAFRVDLLLVGTEGRNFFLGEKFQFGDADPVLTGNHAIQRAGEVHDALDGFMGRLQHVVIVGIDRNVGMHVTVTGVHVQGDKNAAAQHFLVNGFNALDGGTIDATIKNLAQPGVKFLFPGDAYRVILQTVEKARVFCPVGQLTGLNRIGREVQFSLSQRHVEAGQQPCPAQTNGLDIIDRGLPAITDQDLGIERRITPMQRQVAFEELKQGVAQRQLVADRQLNVDALDTVAIVAHAWQRNHDVFIDLESVGVA